MTTRSLGLATLAAVLLCQGGAQTQEAPTSSESAFIQRNRVLLKLAGAQRVVDGAMAKAKEMGLAVNIAVVDDGGHLLAFARMDGARPASSYTAITKATSAATKRGETGPLPPGAENVDAHLSLAVENAAMASGGKFTTLKGGVPIVFDGQIIGAIGVGGATGEQDAEIGKAGAARLLEAIGDNR